MPPDTKTLVILTPGFPANEADTACLPWVQNLVRELKQNFPGVHFVVVAFHYPFKKEDYKWNGVQVTSFNGGNKGGLRRLLLWYAVWRRLSALNKKYHIIGLFSLWIGECALIGKYFGKRHDILHRTWVVGQDAKKDNRWVKRINLRANEMAALSDFIARELQHNYGVRPQFTIPGGVDPNEYAQPPAARDIDVMGAGSLIPLKQFNVFIEVIAEVRKRHPNIQSLIVGKGPEQQSLQSQIRSLDLQANLELIGEVSYQEVLRRMQRTKIFVHTSSYEGLGMVCTEALYAGAHVISFVKPFEKDIPHWHIVRNKEEMLEKLLELLHDPMLDHSPVMHFAAKDTATAVMNLYNTQ
ncbi:MAG TPA: glycosyltransferase family 4 protein [Chitinophagaceae bacterium]